LIDMSDNVQIIDFGNSEFFFDNYKHIYCHFEGTLSYMPPEYFQLSRNRVQSNNPKYPTRFNKKRNIWMGTKSTFGPWGSSFMSYLSGTNPTNSIKLDSSAVPSKRNSIISNTLI
jgi:serine/threonine protein kinase